MLLMTLQSSSLCAVLSFIEALQTASHSTRELNFLLDPEMALPSDTPSSSRLEKKP